MGGLVWVQIGGQEEDMLYIYNVNAIYIDIILLYICSM